MDFLGGNRGSLGATDVSSRYRYFLGDGSTNYRLFPRASSVRDRALKRERSEEGGRGDFDVSYTARIPREPVKDPGIYIPAERAEGRASRRGRTRARKRRSAKTSRTTRAIVHVTQILLFLRA